MVVDRPLIDFGYDLIGANLDRLGQILLFFIVDLFVFLDQVEVLIFLLKRYLVVKVQALAVILVILLLLYLVL